jgi:hypothetical protein
MGHDIPNADVMDQVVAWLAIRQRWPDSEAARTSQDVMEKILADKDQAEILEKLRLDDDRKSYGAQARGLERVRRFSQAIDVWNVLARNHRDTPTAEEALAEVRRLQELKPVDKDQKPAGKVERKKRGGKR